MEEPSSTSGPRAATTGLQSCPFPLAAEEPPLHLGTCALPRAHPAMILDRLMRGAIWLAALVYIAVFLLLVSRRVPYAGELDYIEGAILDHVVRLAQGQPIFVEPSLEFVPLAYMPGFAFVSSLECAGSPST